MKVYELMSRAESSLAAANVWVMIGGQLITVQNIEQDDDLDLILNIDDPLIIDDEGKTIEYQWKCRS